jgi:hypothetical protein
MKVIRMSYISYVVVLLSLLTLRAFAEERGAKAIFHSGEGPTVMASSSGTIEETKPTVTSKKATSTIPQVEKYMGISYWIELLDSTGQRNRVTTASTFRSGDRIKLHIETNQNGYLYVINVGSTGQSHFLFPNSGVNSNFVTAWTPYEIPYNTYMRFDANPGEELLLVMLSPNPIGNMPFTPSINRPLNNQETQQYTQLAQAKGAKDIVLETESTGINPASYVVAPMSSLGSGMITLKIKLRHR